MKGLHFSGLGAGFVVVWSSGYVVGSLAAQVMLPLTLTFWRFVVAALALAALACWRREPWPRRRDLAAVAAVGLPMFALQFGALYTAMADGMPPATTALIACSAPLVVAVISASARWERLTVLGWLGVGLGVAGVAITLSDGVGRPPSLLVLLWALAGLAGLAGGTILHSRLHTTAGPLSVASVEVGTGAAVLAVWAPMEGSMSMAHTGYALATFAWVALVSGAGGPLILFALIRRRGATGASSLLFVVPAVTAFAAWLLLGSPLAPTVLLGLGVAGTGLVLTRRGLRPTARPRGLAIPPVGLRSSTCDWHYRVTRDRGADS